MKSMITRTLLFTGLSLAMFQYAVADDAIHVTPAGDVGFGTNTPTEKVHIKDGDFMVEQSTPGTHAILKFATAGSSWEIKQNGDTGRLTFISPGGVQLRHPLNSLLLLRRIFSG